MQFLQNNHWQGDGAALDRLVYVEDDEDALLPRQWTAADLTFLQDD